MMRRILLRMLINAIALWVAVQIVPGIHAENPLTILIVALIFGVVNAILRPLVTFFTCPMILLTLGLFIFVINAMMLWFTAWVAGRLHLGFWIEGGFWPASSLRFPLNDGCGTLQAALVLSLLVAAVVFDQQA